MPEATPHTGRDIAVVAGAVVILALGFLILKYSPQAAPAAATTTGASMSAEQKQQILKSAQDPQASTGPQNTPAQSAQILENAHASSSASTSTQLTAEQKQQLLQSAGK